MRHRSCCLAAAVLLALAATIASPIAAGAPSACCPGQLCIGQAVTLVPVLARPGGTDAPPPAALVLAGCAHRAAGEGIRVGETREQLSPSTPLRCLLCILRI